MIDLSGKVAVVTGAAAGIGEAIVDLFIAAGANIVAVDLDPSLAEKFARHPADRLACVIGDVGLESTAQAYAHAAVDIFGGIDVMINNAGIAVVKPIVETTPEEWDRVFNVNVKALYWSARSVVPIMKKAGKGLFLNTGSISSMVGIEGQGVYGPSKGAVIQVTRQMAIEYAKDGIRVNAVCPGTVDTPMLRDAAEQTGDPEAFLQELGSKHPIGRIAAPEEIAQFHLFLASDHARFFTGSILMIDGGFTAC